MVDAGERCESIPLAGGIRLSLQEGCNQLRGVGNERGRVLVDGCNGKDGVLPDVGVSVLEAGSR